MLIAELELEAPGASRELPRSAADWCNAERPDRAGDRLRAGRRQPRAGRVAGRAPRDARVPRRARPRWSSRGCGSWTASRSSGGRGWRCSQAGSTRSAAGRGRPRTAWPPRSAASRWPPSLDDTTVPRLALLRAALCPDGVERMQADAQFAVDSLDLLSPWRAKALLLVGWSQLLRGMDDAADATLTDAARASAAGLTNTSSIALAGRAVLAARAATWSARTGWRPTPIERLGSGSLTARATSAVCYAVGRADRCRAGSPRRRPGVARGRTPAAPPGHARPALDGGAEPARRGPGPPAAGRGRAGGGAVRRGRAPAAAPPAAGHAGRAGRRGAAGRRAPRGPDGWTDSLTPAELRLLPLLTTHLSFREIADRLFVSRNTVKTQAISVYRKLGASSRSEAVDRAERARPDRTAASGFHPLRMMPAASAALQSSGGLLQADPSAACGRAGGLPSPTPQLDCRTRAFVRLGATDRAGRAGAASYRARGRRRGRRRRDVR